MGIRQDRLSHQLQQEIATIIQRELKDPRLGFVTITRVTLSNDLSYAKVGFSCLGDPDACSRTQDALDHAVGFIRSLVKKRFRLKIIPTIVFQYDDSVAQAIALSETFDRLNAPSSRSRPPSDDEQD